MGLWKKQKSEVRSQNEEHLLSADCLRRAAGPPAGRGKLRAGPALRLLTADCLLHMREAGWRGFFAGMPALDKMSPPTMKEKTSNFKK